MPGFEGARRMLGWGGAATVLAVVAGVWMWSAAAATSASASISCSSGTVVFGADIECVVAGPDDALVDWGDGAVSGVGAGGEMSHSPQRVGELVTHVTGSDGTVLASRSLTVVPDLAIDCEDGPDELPVYELMAAEGINPWGYVYLEADGTRIEPGDVGYHRAGLGNFDRVRVDSRYRTSSCRPRSAALDGLGGSVSWWVDSEFYEPYEIPVRRIAPTSKGYWDGLQPGQMVVTIEVAGVSASERVDVYFSGCT